MPVPISEGLGLVRGDSGSLNRVGTLKDQISEVVENVDRRTATECIALLIHGDGDADGHGSEQIAVQVEIEGRMLGFVAGDESNHCRAARITCGRLSAGGKPL